MPSIAQQDYLRPSGKTLNDCHLLAALAHNIQQGTIFDTIFGTNESDSDIIDYSKVVGLRKTDMGYDLSVVEVASPEIFNLSVRYSETQYEGLAAIQDAAENHNAIPDLAVNERGELVSVGDIDDYITSGTSLLIPTIENGKIVSIAKSQSKDPDCTDIPWEDVQKLIGLPIQD